MPLTVAEKAESVSYTHLDVYKRQAQRQLADGDFVRAAGSEYRGQ